MKTNLLAIAGALLASATISSAAVSVPAGGVTVDFAAPPPGADFASVSVAGGTGDLTAIGDLGTEIDNPTNGISASLAWPAAVTNWSAAANSIADEPVATALNAQIRYVTNAQKMLTGPTGNRYHALIGRFQNNTGAGIASLDLNWTVGSPFPSAGGGAFGTDPLAGVHVYFSKTGLLNSWTRLGGPFGDAAGPVGVVPVTFTGSIGVGGSFYIAWIDDNGPVSGTDPDFEGHYTVDDVVISNVVAATCAISASLTPVTRLPGANPVDLADDLAAFSATITGTGTVGPGWRIAAGESHGGNDRQLRRHAKLLDSHWRFRGRSSPLENRRPVRCRMFLRYRDHGTPIRAQRNDD